MIIVPDPASANRSQTDEKTTVKIFRDKGFQVEVESNNRWPLRQNAIDHFCNKLIGGSPALQLDPVHCPTLLRAAKGGWRYAIDVKKDQIKGALPEDNPFTHPGDAFAYGLRYYHKGIVREEKQGTRKFVPPSYRSNDYHAR